VWRSAAWPEPAEPHCCTAYVAYLSDPSVRLVCRVAEYTVRDSRRSRCACGRVARRRRICVRAGGRQVARLRGPPVALSTVLTSSYIFSPSRLDGRPTAATSRATVKRRPDSTRTPDPDRRPRPPARAGVLRLRVVRGFSYGSRGRARAGRARGFRVARRVGPTVPRGSPAPALSSRRAPSRRRGRVACGGGSSAGGRRAIANAANPNPRMRPSPGTGGVSYTFCFFPLYDTYLDVS
jgi:hypothetical protein